MYHPEVGRPTAQLIDPNSGIASGGDVKQTGLFSVTLCADELPGAAEMRVSSPEAPLSRPDPIHPDVPGRAVIGKKLAGGPLVLVVLILPVGFLLLFLAGFVDVGSHRWPVKTFRDRDRSRVNLAPVDTTVAALTRLSRPADAAFRSLSRIAPEELAVYRIRATLRRVRYGPDGDIHMALSDPKDPSRSIIAEIPHPLLSLGSGFERIFRAERIQVRNHVHDRDQTVEITGIGFFDYHRRDGAATNGFELHPVIGLKFVRTR